MNLKKENGVTNADMVIGMIIFIIGAATILTLYLQIYKLTSKIKIDQTAIGYITEICEQIDLNNYEDITVENVNTIISNAKIPSNYEITCSNIENYSSNYKDETGNDIPDVVKKVFINVKYNFDNYSRNYQVSKIKVKE